MQRASRKLRPQVSTSADQLLARSRMLGKRYSTEMNEAECAFRYLDELKERHLFRESKRLDKKHI